MTTNFATQDFIETTSTDENFSMKNTLFVSQPDFSADYKKILSQTTISIKALSNTFYKQTPYLETSDIENIKKALNNYRCENENVNEFKKSIVADLTNFQNEIENKYINQVAILEKEKHFCERQINVLDFKKQKHIMDNLSKIKWPYDQTTKSYENNIASLQIKIQNYKQRILEAQRSKPQANEKDILLYQLHLKEKYAK